MKKMIFGKRIFFAFLCLLLLAGVLSPSAFAAKEMFTTYRIDDVTITGIDAPVAGKPFDFTAEEASQKYNVIKVAWRAQYRDNYITDTSTTPAAGTQYSVYVVLEVASANHYFPTDSGRNSTISSVTVNRNTASANNIQDTTLFAVDASKYDHDTTYQKYLTVIYTFPTVEAAPIESVGFSVPAPVPGERVPTTWQTSGISIDTVNGSGNNGQISVQKVEWTLQSGTALPGNAVFEYGQKYTLKLTLSTIYGTKFATDPNHFFAQPGKPYPAVEVTMNGRTATVLPTYDSYSNLYVVASCTFDCNTAAKIQQITLTDLDAPAAGQAPDYTFTGGAGYGHNGRNDAYYQNGVCWSEAGGSYVVADGTHAFMPGKAYQVDIRLKAQTGYEFATNAYGNVSAIATVNGKVATVSGNRNEILITYTFPATGNIAVSKVGAIDIDAPEEGKTPDYTAAYTNVNYGPANYNDATTKNGISWYSETDGKTLRTGDKFEAGKTYTVRITIWSGDGYAFQYKAGAVDVAGTVNGKSAEVTSRSDEEVTLHYTFPKTAEHKHSTFKIDEVKATCQNAGKKAYYLCSACGKAFEDSKGNTEIPDVNVWGVTEKLAHSGGKATCEERAVCKNCGEAYGMLAEHNFGSGWDYKDAVGHAHKCKNCGAHDTVKPHTGGTAKCGETAKCAECKAEYGEVAEHKWSTDWTHTDAKGHARACTVCGEKDKAQPHTGGTADCQNPAKCSVCGTEYGKTGDHKWSTEWDYTDAKGHAHKCTVKGCDAHSSTEKHTAGAAATETTAQTCTVCKYVITPAKTHEHSLTKVDKVNATCTESGKDLHYVCDGCGKMFEDAKAKTEITDPDSLIIAAKGHKEKWNSDAENHWRACSVEDCGAVILEKEAHKFNKAGKCTDCGYKQGEDPASAETEDTADTPETTLPAVPGEDTTPAPDTDGTKEPAPAGGNAVMWGGVAASAAVAAACVVVMVIVLKKNKKNG